MGLASGVVVSLGVSVWLQTIGYDPRRAENVGIAAGTVVLALGVLIETVSR